jgi:hypothetical protein
MKHGWWVLAALAAPAAHAEPWLCTLPDGRKEFSYDAESARNPRCVDNPLSRGYVRLAPPPGAEPVSAHADFPRVDAKTQKKRDVARREILERELAAERKGLADAMRELAELKQAQAAAAAPSIVRQYEERIRTHRTNIANLEKELAAAG